MLIFPAIATPLTVFFMKLYLQATFSMEIVESGRIAGASEFRIFNQLVLPLLKPAIATQVIFSFVSNWNNQFVPSIILIDEKSKTLRPIYTENTLIIIGLPVIIYLICSRFIVEGVALGSVKK
jgi:multiple sugar transport system permease protein